MNKSVTLEIKGLGHIPAIKNSMFSIVNRQNREWKRRCVKSLLSQLLSSLPITERETLTPRSLQFLTALLPRDDSWKDLPDIRLLSRKVEPGDEGAMITIERIEDEHKTTP